MKKSAQQLIEETRKRMEQLYEYSFYSHGTYEDGEQAPADPVAAGGDPAAMGAPADPMAGGDPAAAGGAAPMPGADPAAMGAPADPAAAGGDPAAMGAPADPMAGGMNLAPNAGGAPADPNAMGVPMPGDPAAMGAPTDPMSGDPAAGGPGPNDNVIEISQLTDTQTQMQQAQDEQNEKLDGVDRKLTTLMSIVDKFTQALDANDAKLNDLKDELRKRTPTEEETMNVRLDAGGNPFKQKPEEFWDKFEDINNHYNITSNNEAPQFQIKKGDIDNINDKLVENDLEDIPSSLKEYFTR